MANISNNNNPFSGREEDLTNKNSGDWHRVGQASDANWWESGNRQQQQVYRGDTGYPYRDNFDQRNRPGQGGMENFYPQEPASEQQKRNFAEGTQYPYEGGYGAGNIQARQGLERAGKMEPGKPQQSGPHHLNYPAPASGHFLNHNKNTMRQDDRDYRRDYNDYRDREYGRERDRRDDRDFGFNADRSRRDNDQYRDRGGYNPERDFRGYDRDSGRGISRGYEQDRPYNSDRFSDRNRGYEQDDNYRTGQDERGNYYSTRSSNPGRGYDTEWEMNRHSDFGDSGRDRGYYSDNDRNYREIRNNRPDSRHRATGSYDDFERDLDRFGMRRSDEDRYRESDRQSRRPHGRFDHPATDRGPSGAWGRNVRDSDREYRSSGRYGDRRDRY